jgi:hypothetical protein
MGQKKLKDGSFSFSSSLASLFLCLRLYAREIITFLVFLSAALAMTFSLSGTFVKNAYEKQLFRSCDYVESFFSESLAYSSNTYVSLSGVNYASTELGSQYDLFMSVAGQAYHDTPLCEDESFQPLTQKNPGSGESYISHQLALHHHLQVGSTLHLQVLDDEFIYRVKAIIPSLDYLGSNQSHQGILVIGEDKQIVTRLQKYQSSYLHFSDENEFVQGSYNNQSRVERIQDCQRFLSFCLAGYALLVFLLFSLFEFFFFPQRKCRYLAAHSAGCSLRRSRRQISGDLGWRGVLPFGLPFLVVMPFYASEFGVYCLFLAFFCFVAALGVMPWWFFYRRRLHQ